MSTTRTVTAAVRAALVQRGMPVAELSRRSGIPYSTLDRRLNADGASPFTVVEVGNIAAALHVSPADLMELEKTRDPAGVGRVTRLRAGT